MLRKLLMGLMGSVMVGAVMAGTVTPANAYTLLCEGKTKTEVAACDTSGYAAAMQKSHWRAYAGHNCTNYAAYRMTRAGVPEPKILMGNANQWAANAKKLGYKVTKTPAVGAVASWSKSSSHLAYVEAVGKDHIVLSDDSYGSKVFKRYRANTGDRWYPEEFIHFSSAPPAVAPKPTPQPVVKPVVKPKPKPVVAKPLATTVTLRGPGTIKKSKKPTVKVWLKTKNSKVRPHGRVSVYRGKKKLTSVTVPKSAKGYVAVKVPRQKKGKHVFTVVLSGNSAYKKSSKKVTVKVK